MPQTNLIDRTLKYLSGSPIFLTNSVGAVYPPRLREIADVGYSKFLSYVQVLTKLEKPVTVDNLELAEIIEPLNNFEYLLLLTQVDPQINTLVHEALMFFLHDSVTFIVEPPQIVIGKLDEKRIVDTTIFNEIQIIIGECCWAADSDVEDITIRETDSEAVRAIKEQMRINRQKLAKAKAKQKKGSNEDIELSDLIASVAVGNCGLNILNIWDITYYAFHDQLRRMGWREQFDINNRAAMAGAKLKKKDLKHWIKSIHSDDKH